MGNEERRGIARRENTASVARHQQQAHRRQPLGRKGEPAQSDEDREGRDVGHRGMRFQSQYFSPSARLAFTTSGFNSTPKPGFRGTADVTLRDQRPFMYDDVIHPIAAARPPSRRPGNRAPRRPTARWPWYSARSRNCAPPWEDRTVPRGRISSSTPAGRRHFADSTCTMSQPWFMMKSLNPCRRARFSPVPMGTLEACARRTQPGEKSGGMGSSSHNGLTGSRASASCMAARRS